MSEEILKSVIDCVAESFAVDTSEVQASTKLITDLNADSLDIMDLMFQLEEEFDIKMEKDDFNFLTKLNMDKDEAVIDEFLVPKAKEELLNFLPELDTSRDLKPAELSGYLSVSSLVKLVELHQEA